MLVPVILLIDDAVMIFLVTWLGLQFHQMDAMIFERLPYTFVPFYLAWVVAAGALQLYQSQVAGGWRQLWRVPLAVALAALPAGAARSLWLGTPLTPVFVLVMAVTLAIGLLASRSFFILAMGSYSHRNG